MSSAESFGISESLSKDASNNTSAMTALPKPRIVRYDEYFNQRTFSTTLRKTSTPDARKKLKKKRPVLVVRRIINERGQHSDTEVDIMSDGLCKVLISLNPEVIGLGLTKSQPVANLRLFFHSRVGLASRLRQEQAKDSPDTSLIDDLTIALEFIAEDHGQTIADFEKMTSFNDITYELLWALFAPSTLVYRFHHLTEQHQVLICRSLQYGQKSDGTRFADLECDVISHDGSAFGLARDYIEIKIFPGSFKIQDLPAYPLDYHKNKEDIRQHAIQRGRKFVQIDRQFCEGGGFGFKDKLNLLNGERKMVKAKTHGRVMIDPEAYRLFEPDSVVNLSVYRQRDKNYLGEEDYIICTPVVLGFCFGTKMWGGFALNSMHDIVWSDEAFHQLALGERQKQLIHALVRQHSSRSASFDDVIVGKGKGLIGLLCGNPGCGKTLTAEASAEITRRPLYAVSAGELGTEPKDVDERLTRILELAQVWDAVLLIDEAEVFLQARNSTDVTRNALVSIFLRQLEYYQGILILTTNKIGECDPAFESRIHFCIKYPDLDFDSRKAVWKTFLRKTLRDPNDISEEDIIRLAEQKMNGRQIKNAVSSAQSIALDQKSRLLIKHIDTVLDVINDWQLATDTAF